MAFTGEATWRWRMLLPSTDTRVRDVLAAGGPLAGASGRLDAVTAQAPAGGSPGDTLPMTVFVRSAAFAAGTRRRRGRADSGPDGRLDRARVRGGDAARPDATWRDFGPEESGVYRVTRPQRRGTTRLGTASTAVLVGSSDLEMTDPAPQPAAAPARGARVRRPAHRAGRGRRPRGVAARRGAGGELAVRRDLWHNTWSFAHRPAPRGRVGAAAAVGAALTAALGAGCSGCSGAGCSGCWVLRESGGTC
jgi:hypothetical protein